MRLLIDTQAILWFQSSDAKLSETAKNLILNTANICFVSIASLWEISIKVGSKKLDIGMPFDELKNYLLNYDFNILNIDFSHLSKLSSLESYHKDPFDRILISQAISEKMPIISVDTYFSSYPVQVIW